MQEAMVTMVGYTCGCGFTHQGDNAEQVMQEHVSQCPLLPQFNGGPAFPSPTGNPIQHGQLSVRDYFAAQALTGLINGSNLTIDNPDKAATWAYQFADAMLQARKG